MEYVWVFERKKVTSNPKEKLELANFMLELFSKRFELN